MKFVFEIKSEDNPRAWSETRVRAMLMRGFHAFQADKAEYQRDHDLAILGSETMYRLMGTPEVTRGYIQDCERYAAEERAWKELLLSFTSVENG